MTVEKRLDRAGEMDKQAFEKLFREYFTPLMAFSRRILGDEDNAREVVHQVFIKLWERRSQIDLSTSLKSYLFTAVNNRSLNVIRDRRKFSSEKVPERAGEWDVSAQIEAMELEEKIQAAIQILPERCRVIFELNRFDGLKYSEIASQLDISVKTVENQMSKALKILREQLARYLTILLWLVLYTLN
ncbi:MAG: RNA polymerase sigma-70 factor [Bacteroidetes bacterium]|nr:MAG: RNA polymerase sigma-70 factor [Bacteroidota bacterium]RLD69381.1 MAG: RNA polymerase sigma-70 factor [Bacteroidota bacterium]RLD91845.1 MAG: RNA polymerase sigma-70 factor [Bacteroidota bacterium]